MGGRPYRRPSFILLAPGRPRRRRWSGIRSTALPATIFVLLEAAPDVTRHRLGIGRALLFETALASRRHARRPARAVSSSGSSSPRLTELRVFGGVDGRRLGRDLARDLLVIARSALRGVGMHLRAVDRQHTVPHQPGVGAQIDSGR